MISILSELLWGLPTLVILMGFGIYFTYKCSFFKPTSVLSCFRKTFFAKSNGGVGMSSFSALATALGGTVGVGSIGGVALAISIGGAGSVFWMWLCSLLGFGLKYAEVALCHSRRVYYEGAPTGGPMYCLRSMGYRRLGTFYAFLCVGSAVIGGNAVQVQAVSALYSPFADRRLVALIIAATVAFAVYGGKRRIASLNTVLLPVLTFVFIFFSLSVLICYSSQLPLAFGKIFGEALGFRQMASGVGAGLMIRTGCARGTFSTEAGMGSAAISYCAASETDSHTQGLWGVTEVFIDSFVISTLTALCILCVGANSASEMFVPMFGAAGEWFYKIAVSFFAFAAVISWCFYGEEALKCLTKKRWAAITFRTAAVVSCFFCAMLTEGSVFALADIWGALMLYPNLFMLFKARSDIFEMAKHECSGGACGNKKQEGWSKRR